MPVGEAGSSAVVCMQCDAALPAQFSPALMEDRHIDTSLLIIISHGEE